MKRWVRDNWEALHQRWRGKRFPKGFEEWYQTAPRRDGNVLSLEEFRRNRQGQPDDIIKQFTAEAIRPNARWRAISLGRLGSQGRFELPFRDGLPSLSDADATIEDFTVPDGTEACTITGGLIRTLALNGQHNGRIRLSKCLIARLSIPEGRKFRIEMTDCWIGLMSLGQASLASLRITGGGIGHIDCPPPDSSNPFVGSVTFSRHVFFPVSSRETSLFEGPQGYRNLRAHLETLDNAPAANHIRAIQLRSERRDEKGITSSVNRLYDFFSEYGSNMAPPVWWLLSVYLATAGIIFQWDGGILTQPVQAYVGAYRSFLDWNNGQMWRSLLLPFQSIFNPFGFFFDARKLVIPANSWASALLFVQGLFSDLMLVLFVICLRRRFKLH